MDVMGKEQRALEASCHTCQILSRSSPHDLLLLCKNDILRSVRLRSFVINIPLGSL